MFGSRLSSTLAGKELQPELAAKSQYRRDNVRRFQVKRYQTYKGGKLPWLKCIIPHSQSFGSLTLEIRLTRRLSRRQLEGESLAGILSAAHVAHLVVPNLEWEYPTRQKKVARRSVAVRFLVSTNSCSRVTTKMIWLALLRIMAPQWSFAVGTMLEKGGKLIISTAGSTFLT
jgi:hypothetical protein